jgi:hypothetical protein
MTRSETVALHRLPTLAPPQISSSPGKASGIGQQPGGEAVFLHVEADQTGIEVSVEDN